MLFHFGSAWGGLSFGLAIRFWGSCDGHLLGRRLLIQSSGLANRVNRASPTWSRLGRSTLGLAVPISEIFTGIRRSLGPACPTLVPRIAGTVLSHFGPCRARPVGYCVLANFVSPKPPSPAPPLRVGFCARARTVSFVRPPPLLSFAAHRLLACDLHHWTRQSLASTGRSPRCMRGPQPQPRRPSKFGPQASTSSPTTSMLLSKLESPR